MALSGPVRRVRAFAGHLALLAVLGLVAAFLVTGGPRMVNELSDRGLRQDYARLPYPAREVKYLHQWEPGLSPTPSMAEAKLPVYQSRLPGPVRGLVEDQWFAGEIPSGPVAFSGPAAPFNGMTRPQLGLRTQSGSADRATLVAGRWPANKGSLVEVAISRRTGELLNLTTGTVLTASQAGLPPAVDRTAQIKVVGVFEPRDPTDPFWLEQQLLLKPRADGGDGPWRGILLTDPIGLERAAQRVGVPPRYEWHYRLTGDALDVPRAESVLTALAEVKRQPPEPEVTPVVLVDAALSGFLNQLRAVRALLAVVQAGLLAGLLGLLLLATRLAVGRRRAEFALLRARGAASWDLGTRTLAESLLVLPGAVFAGWALGSLVPGRRSSLELLVLVVALATVLAVPIGAVFAHRRVDFVGRREDLVRSRPSARRLTAEISVLVLAGLGVLLLRRRGLDPGSGVDPYLVSVPVLLALGAAVVALRIFPVPLRQFGRLTGRSRGAVPFLGLARAGRAAPVSVGPLAVLVLAISTGVFSAVVAAGIADARDRATDLALAGDVRLTGYAFAPETADRIAALPGVTAVAAMSAESGRELRSGSGAGTRDLGQAQTVVVDGRTMDQVVRASGADLRLPRALVDATRTDGPVPAVVSPEVAADVGAGGIVDVQGRRYEFRVAAVVPSFPGLGFGDPGRGDTARRFVVLPWQAMPVPDFKPVIPTRFVVAGDGFSATALRDVGDVGQRAYLADVLGHEVAEPEVPTTVTTWRAHRAALDATGSNGVLRFAFLAGTLGAFVLALVAVGFTVLAEAAGRGRTLSRLRTMGLSPGQGRALLVYELGPLVLAAVLAGGLVGVALPRLLAGTFGLTAFTAGAPTTVRLDPVTLAGLLLLVVAALVLALGTEQAINRRMRLGAVLRVGEEHS